MLIFIIIIGVAFLVGVYSGLKLKIDKLFFLLINLALLVEILDYTVFDTNHELFASYIMVQALLLHYIFFRDTGSIIQLSISPLLIIIEYLLFLFADVSLTGLLLKYNPSNQLVEVNRFFDAFTLSNIIITINVFYWIWWIVNNSDFNKSLTNKRLIYAFGMLIFFGGSFFIVAFSRLLLPDFDKWIKIWSIVYVPLYILFYASISIAFLWKTSTSSS